ncbi:MAG: nucleoside deaminase [Acholeplasmataceae bacterium]|jgi:tRNA(Arg) A34 adenosine deaminase TadA|nr:nucleoside deaminase [Acholeplasmataceae bacterium]
MLSKQDLIFARRSVELAKISLDQGDEPFGSLLVSASGEILYEGHNEVSSGDQTRHPEFEIARWAAKNLTEKERKEAIVYTSNEHCPMCAAAHGWVGLGKIVYVASASQLMKWLKEVGAPVPRVKPLPIQEVIRDVEVVGPILEFSEILKSYHQQNYLATKKMQK